jgi:glycosyltransferase involved in cell wall biosynthesis
MNEGVSATRNLGIKESRGEFIQFVDSDDYIDERMCEKLLEAIENSDLAICGLKVWQRGTLLRAPHLERNTYNLRESIDIYFNLRKINLGPCNKLYRKDKISKGFREDLSLGEDSLFVLDYMRNINNVAVIEDCLYNVCLDNDNSLNRSSKIDKIDSLIEQRVIEEQFLRDMYGEDCNLTDMYGCYLKLMHSCFLQIGMNTTIDFKDKCQKYIDNNFLQSKISKAYLKRLDYRLFKFLFVRKYINLILLYFKVKVLLIDKNN